MAIDIRIVFRQRLQATLRDHLRKLFIRHSEGAVMLGATASLRVSVHSACKSDAATTLE